jgi:hypothetical protein
MFIVLPLYADPADHILFSYLIQSTIQFIQGHDVRYLRLDQPLLNEADDFNEILLGAYLRTC